MACIKNATLGTLLLKFPKKASQRTDHTARYAFDTLQNSMKEESKYHL